MKLIKILSDRIQIKTDALEFEDARINDLIRISDGIVSLVTMIISMTDTEIEDKLEEFENIEFLKSTKVIECAIIGSIKNGKFSKAVDIYPTVDIVAEPMEDSEFSQMLVHDPKSSFSIGKYVNYNAAAFVDGNKFYQRHSCIVGNTGSGKSETVAKIMEETAKLPGCNIITFDIHGEYSKLSYVDNIEIGNDIPFPIWMFGFSDMVTNILKVREESATVAMSALRKMYRIISKKGNEDKPVYFDFDRLLDAIEELNEQMVGTGEYYKTGDKAGMQKMIKGDYNGKLSNLVNTMKALRNNVKYSFLFSGEEDAYLYKFMSRIMGNHRPVKNIDLSGIPHDIAIQIIGVITKLVYGIQIGNKNRYPITMICDEAHVYIPNNFQLAPSERRMVEIFENIAKEGRKFGFTLFVASQRPSELNKTIMAQCANFIVSKLNNENDKSMIKGMLPDGNETIIDTTTMFSPGDVLVIGDAAPIPMKIHVELAKERPQSRTIAFWDEWKKPFELDVENAIAEYMKN